MTQMKKCNMHWTGQLLFWDIQAQTLMQHEWMNVPKPSNTNWTSRHSHVCMLKIVILLCSGSMSHFWHKKKRCGSWVSCRDKVCIAEAFMLRDTNYILLTALCVKQFCSCCRSYLSKIFGLCFFWLSLSLGDNQKKQLKLTWNHKRNPCFIIIQSAELNYSLHFLKILFTAFRVRKH